MKLDAALAGVTRLGFDTPPFIYLVENHPTHAALVQDVFQRAYHGRLLTVSSTVTVTETLTLPRRAGDVGLEATYRRFLLGGRNLSLVAIDTAVADQAATLRARYGLRTPDALQVAAALHAGCEAFLSNDNGLRRVTELRVLILDDLEL